MSDVNLQLTKLDNLALGISHTFECGDERQLDIYFSLPAEMGINPDTLSEEKYFYTGIKGQRFYFAEGVHLPSVGNRVNFIKQQDVEQYRLSMNLFSYQFSVAIENDVNALLHTKSKEYLPKLDELQQQIQTLLNEFRDSQPEEIRKKSYFEHTDNYLSWFCEQELLRVLAKTKAKLLSEEKRQQLLLLCRQEREYREFKKYNAQRTISDPNRITNKMLLTQMLLRQGVVLKKELRPLGVTLKKLTTGLAMAFVMLFITVMVLAAKAEFSNLTMALVISMAVIYGLREIFKDDVKRLLWRWVRKGRPKWYQDLIDPNSKQHIAKQFIWLDYSNEEAIPKDVQQILSRRKKQNKLDAQILHYRIRTQVTQDTFPLEYSTFKEQVQFSFIPLTRYLQRGKKRIYTEQNGEINSEAVEKRFQVNMVVSVKNNLQKTQFYRYKVILNRNTIVDVFRAETIGD